MIRDGSTLEQIRTEDGSATLRLREHGVSFRSTAGASSESEHVFIDGCRLKEREGPWRVVELGFGAGTTFEAAVRSALEVGAEIEYWAVERAPVPSEMVCATGIAREMAVDVLDIARDALSGPVSPATTVIAATRPGITLHLCATDWLGAPLPGDAHAVFFDPFSPAIEPDSWTTDAFVTAASCLADDGILATYSSAGSVRRAIQDAGMVVSTRPGVGRKREVTVAVLTDGCGVTSPAT